MFKHTNATKCIKINIKLLYAIFINILYLDAIQYNNVQRNVYILDLSKQTCNLYETGLNNVAKSSENKGEMLLEAISSDDDIAINSEEDNVHSLVMFQIN